MQSVKPPVLFSRLHSTVFCGRYTRNFLQRHYLGPDTSGLTGPANSSCCECGESLHIPAQVWAMAKFVPLVMLHAERVACRRIRQRWCEASWSQADILIIISSTAEASESPHPIQGYFTPLNRYILYYDALFASHNCANSSCPCLPICPSRPWRSTRHWAAASC